MFKIPGIYLARMCISQQDEKKRNWEFFLFTVSESVSRNVQNSQLLSNLIEAGCEVTVTVFFFGFDAIFSELSGCRICHQIVLVHLKVVEVGEVHVVVDLVVEDLGVVVEEEEDHGLMRDSGICDAMNHQETSPFPLPFHGMDNCLRLLV